MTLILIYGFVLIISSIIWLTIVCNLFIDIAEFLYDKFSSYKEKQEFKKFKREHPEEFI